MKISDMPKRIPDSLVKAVRDWIEPGGGIEFFRNVIAEHGKLDAAWMENGKIRTVICAEGEQVMIFMATRDECKKWSRKDIERVWEDVILKAIA